jgi:hypothetical protein
MAGTLARQLRRASRPRRRPADWEVTSDQHPKAPVSLEAHCPMIPCRSIRTLRLSHGLATLFGPLAVLLGGCATEPATPQPMVYFALDAPLCGTRLPVAFSIDDLQVGTDTFIVNLVPEHLTSVGFRTTVGQHTLGAQVVDGYIWPDTVVVLSAGGVVTYTLPFYCS